MPASPATQPEGRVKETWGHVELCTPCTSPAAGAILFHVLGVCVSSLFVMYADINLRDPPPVSTESDIPPGCSSAVMLLLSMVKWAWEMFVAPQEWLRVLLWSTGVLLGVSADGN